MINTPNDGTSVHLSLCCSFNLCKKNQHFAANFYSFSIQKSTLGKNTLSCWLKPSRLTWEKQCCKPGSNYVTGEIKQLTVKRHKLRPFKFWHLFIRTRHEFASFKDEESAEGNVMIKHLWPFCRHIKTGRPTRLIIMTIERLET